MLSYVLGANPARSRNVEAWAELLTHTARSACLIPLGLTMVGFGKYSGTSEQR